MLHLAGMRVQDIYEDLPDPAPMNKDEDIVCLRKKICRTSDMFFVNLRRHKGSSLPSLWHVYVNRESLEENLPDQLIEKVPDVDLKKKLPEVNNITLYAAMDKVRKWEASRKQASQIDTPNQEVGAGTNGIEENSRHGSKGKSFCCNCGKVGHLLKVRVVQLEVGSAVSVVNMVIFRSLC